MQFMLMVVTQSIEVQNSNFTVGVQIEVDNADNYNYIVLNLTIIFIYNNTASKYLYFDAI